MAALNYHKKNQHAFIGWNNKLADSLIPISIEGIESMSMPYHYEITSRTLLSEEDLIRWHGESVSCRVGNIESTLPQRQIHGVVTRIGYQHNKSGDAECVLTLEPSLALLDIGRDMKVWQNISIPDLVTRILQDHGITRTDRLLYKQYPKKEYCVQYRESTLTFIQRLLEEEGIYYFFTHDSESHTLILADHPASHKAIQGNSLHWHHQGEILTKGNIDSAWSTTDTLPAGVALLGVNSTRGMVIEDHQQTSTTHRYADKVRFIDITPKEERALITRQARNLVDTREANAVSIAAHVNAHWLNCGETFDLIGHSANAKCWRIHSLKLKAENNRDNARSRYQCEINVQDSDKPWLPPHRYGVPEIAGILTATVVGPDSEEIHTDEYGRVNIQFPWDRDNPARDTSSCWVRVAQPWAGDSFGAQFIPRIGSEVLVSFIQGHPNHPLITGTVYNGRSRPPFTLPDNKNESGFMTRSTPAGKHEEGHRLSFNDKKGAELLTVVAQRDMQVTVKHNAFSTICANRTTELTKGDDQLLLKQGDLKFSLDKGNWEQNVIGNITSNIKNGNYRLRVTGGDGNIVTDKALRLESTQSIELKVGGNKITLSPGGISINGTMINLGARGTAELKGAMTTITGSGMTRITGGLINIG